MVFYGFYSNKSHLIRKMSTWQKNDRKQIIVKLKAYNSMPACSVLFCKAWLMWTFKMLHTIKQCVCKLQWTHSRIWEVWQVLKRPVIKRVHLRFKNKDISIFCCVHKQYLSNGFLQIWKSITTYGWRDAQFHLPINWFLITCIKFDFK